MVLKEYGDGVKQKMFTYVHFQVNKGFHWSSTKRKFSTPQVRQMKSNQNLDYNLGGINILEKIRATKQKKRNKRDKNS